MVFKSIAELPLELTVSINHIARVSAPFISPLTLLLLYLPGLFISLFLWKIALFCLSAAHPPPAYRACVRVCLRAGGRSIHLRSAELLTADFKKINHSQVRGEGMRKQRGIKGMIFFLPHSSFFVRSD